MQGRYEPVIGVNLRATPDPYVTRKKLETFREDGFDAVEVSLDSFPLIIDGRPCKPWIDYLERMLSDFPFSYSAHIGKGLNLRDSGNFKKHMEILTTSIDICSRLKLSPLVLHYELESRDKKVERDFLEAHREAAGYAAQHGVTIVVENIEVELVEPVIDFVAEIDSPNLRFAFDTGHAFLASKYFHFDFFEAFRKGLPYLGHIHLSDNTGTFEELRITDRRAYDSLPMGMRFEYGRGDIHLPPYFGKVPYDELFDILFSIRPQWEGMFICEYYSDMFLPFNREVQEKVRRSIVEARERYA